MLGEEPAGATLPESTFHVCASAPRIHAVIPAYDEAPAIRRVVAGACALRRSGRPLFARVIVVDNGSGDNTAPRAAAAGACVVHEPRRGYGSACLAGIAAAADADILVFIDGDGSVALEQTAALLAPFDEGADLVIGVRHKIARGAMSLPQRFGNRLATVLIRLLWRVPVSDLGPFRAIRRESLERLHMQDTRFGWTVEMQVRAIQCGLRTVEVPVQLLPRVGVSKISGTVRGVISAARGILGTIAYLWWTGRRAAAAAAALPGLAPPPAPRIRAAAAPPAVAPTFVHPPRSSQA